MKTLVKILGVIGLVVVVAVFMALPTMWLWNWLMPVIFGLIKIGFWQALGLNLLAGILFQKKLIKFKIVKRCGRASVRLHLTVCIRQVCHNLKHKT
jgi:hypothetical protein